MIREDIKKRFDTWWANGRADRPMIRLLAEKEAYDKSGLIDLSGYKTPEDWHSNPGFRVDWHVNLPVTHDLMYEYVRCADINYGPGTMAAYLGLPPVFKEDTVWYHEIKSGNISEIPLPCYNESAPYYIRHLKQTAEAVKRAAGRFPVCIPDILENLDVLALLRGNEDLCFDLIDEPGKVKEYLDAIAGIYMKYYDAFYNIVKGGESGKECMYMGFYLWGRDKTAKIQCDFSGIISPAQYDEFVLPYLKKQTEDIPYTMYHLDGRDAVRHLPSLLKLEKLNALQWTPGAGQPDCGDEKWYPIYDAAKDAGKALWLYFHDGTPEDMVGRSKKIAERYGNEGLYFLFMPVIKERDKELFYRAFGKE